MKHIKLFESWLNEAAAAPDLSKWLDLAYAFVAEVDSYVRELNDFDEAGGSDDSDARNCFHDNIEHDNGGSNWGLIADDEDLRDSTESSLSDIMVDIVEAWKAFGECFDEDIVAEAYRKTGYIDRPECIEFVYRTIMMALGNEDKIDNAKVSTLVSSCYVGDKLVNASKFQSIMKTHLN